MIRFRNSIIILCLAGLAVTSSRSADENEEWKVRRVDFQGNQTLSAYRLKKVMLTRPSSFLSRKTFHPHIFADDLRSIVQLYQNSGYLEAEITDTLMVRDRTEQALDIRITIQEGERTFVEGISIFGNQVFLDSVLLQKVELSKGDPFRRKRVSEGALAMLTLYANAGYLDAEIQPDVRINSETHRALIDFQIREGPQFSIAEIRIEGAEVTKPKVVRRELSFSPGEVVVRSKLLESQRQLYLTGLFQSVFIRLVAAACGDSAKKDIAIELKENDSIELTSSVGYGTVEKARAKIGLYYHNIFGTGRKLGIIPRISFIYRGVEASYTEPWTLGTRWKTDVNFLIDYMEEPGYNITRTVGRVTVGRPFGRYTSIALTFRNERSELSNVEVTPVPEELDVFVRSLKLTPIFDSRDNLFNTRSGVYLEWSHELAGSFLGGTDTFLRSIWRAKYFHTFGLNTVVGAGLEIGWMDHFGGSEEIPLNERFYAGGPNSLRGFGYQLVGPLDADGTPTGGQFKIVWNALEIRQSIYKMIGAALFLDVGNVWWQSDDFAWDEFRYSPGLGLRVNTPIGIVRGDVGFNVDPKPDENNVYFYFNVGQAF